MAVKSHKSRQGQGKTHSVSKFVSLKSWPYPLRYHLVTYVSPFGLLWGIIEIVGYDEKLSPVGWNFLDRFYFDKEKAVKRLNFLEERYQKNPRKFNIWRLETFA